jgi:hypothetical protein
MSAWSYLTQPVTREMFGFKSAARQEGGGVVERLVKRSLTFIFRAVVYVILAVMCAAMVLLPAYGLIRFVKFAWEG